MPEWITPLLRVLAPMPNRGICSTRKTSLQRCETARATAQPTTPPPMMTMFARSISIRIDDLGRETNGEQAGGCGSVNHTTQKRKRRNEKLKEPAGSCKKCIFDLKPGPEGVDICLA